MASDTEQPTMTVHFRALRDVPELSRRTGEMIPVRFTADGTNRSGVRASGPFKHLMDLYDAGALEFAEIPTAAECLPIMEAQLAAINRRLAEEDLDRAPPKQ